MAVSTMTQKIDLLEELLNKIVFKIRIEKTEIDLNCMLIGGVLNNYLAVSYPIGISTYNDIYEKIQPGKLVKVKFIYDGAIYGFETKIKGTINIPVKMLFIIYPKMIQKYELRKHKRHKCSIPGKIHFLSADPLNSQKLGMTVTDISQMGCRAVLNDYRAELKSLLPADEAISLSMQLPWETGEKQYDGIVRNVTDENKKLLVGIMFDTAIKDLDSKILT
ncbi:flagellar brake protein [Spirochaetota bacterium]